MDLWVLLKRIGYNGHTYDGAMLECTTAPLDPIEVGVVDRSRIRKAMRRFPVLARGFERICTVEAFKELLCEDVIKHVVWTKNVYAEHFLLLESWRMIRETTLDSLLSVCSYFAVPKTSSSSRSIVNGKRFSCLCVVPPPVNIPSIVDVLRRLNSALRSCNRIHIVHGDLRHFFHSIALAEGIERFFGLAMAHRFYAWLRLPMGWSHSPHVAQCLAWLLLVHCEGGEPALFELDVFDGEHLPTFLPLAGGRLGFACITYDNYFCCSSQSEIADAVSRRIQRNAKLFRMTIKEHFHSSPKSLRSGIIYLGLEIRTSLKRRKAEADETALEWRIDSRKITPVLTFATRREIASTIGKCLYRYFTTGQPLALQPAALELIGILRRVAAKQTPNQVQWDARIVLEEESAEILKREWFLRQRNEWITSCYRDIPVSQTCILATDASLTHYGYVILDINGTLMQEFSAPFPLQMANLHIFLLELHAALEGQKAVIGPAKIYHLIDNNAVRHALTRGYSRLL